MEKVVLAGFCLVPVSPPFLKPLAGLVTRDPGWWPQVMHTGNQFFPWGRVSKPEWDVHWEAMAGPQRS